MAYSELVKNLKGIRSYIREFLIYGYKTREDYAKGKSGRTYDDERRRLKNYLGDYVLFSNTENGRSPFISFDTRSVSHNPLFAIYKACSFTDLDITLHFLILELLSHKEKMTTREINEAIPLFLSEASDLQIDESTVRKKVREYVELGLLESEKKGNKIVFFIPWQIQDVGQLSDALNYYSETEMCGVVGEYILDNHDLHNDIFIFKHHTPSAVIESDILFVILEAIHSKQSVRITQYRRKTNKERSGIFVPLQVYKSVQTGRMYIMVYEERNGYHSLRLDYISNISIEETVNNYDELKKCFMQYRKHTWNVSLGSFNGKQNNRRLEHVEFTVFFDGNEKHIYQRLLTEKRIGCVELLDENHARFSADIFESQEIIPWIRTFICRICDVKFSNSNVQQSFISDLKLMNSMYGIGGLA